MNLRRSTIATPSIALIDAVLDGYVAWREESAAVQAAYGNWLQVAREERVLAFAAYSAALDREEYAAGEYRRLIERAECQVAISQLRRATG